MKNQRKVIKKIEADIEKNELLDDKISMFITNLYQERCMEIEKEKKVLLDRFIISTKGKDVVLENRL